MKTALMIPVLFAFYCTAMFCMLCDTCFGTGLMVKYEEGLHHE